MSLTACMDLCKQNSCGAIQYDCNTECLLLPSCESYLDSQCGSSVYIPVASTTGNAASSGQCFPSTANTGEFTCTESKYCSNQNAATQYGAMSLTACMDLCRSNSCGAIQYDCNTECWLLPSCDSSLDSTCGSSLYFRQAPTGECFPNVGNTGEFRCFPEKYCSNQADAVNYGAMTLEQCMAICRTNGCEVFQHDCSRECWLLPGECGSEEATTCGSAIYYRQKDWIWPAAIAEEKAISGECFPRTDAPTGSEAAGFTCTSSVYCGNQEQALKLGPTSLETCLEACVDVLCEWVQYDCNTDCWLFQAGLTCGQRLPSTCGSSIYERVVQPGAISKTLAGNLLKPEERKYSSDEMVGCLGDFPFTVSCDVLPRGSGRAWIEGNWCKATSNDDDKVELIVATCSSAETVTVSGQTSSQAVCPSGYAATSCICRSSSESVFQQACGGKAQFQPVSGQCVVSVGSAEVSAVCQIKQKVWALSNLGQVQKGDADGDVQYCAWTRDSFRDDADCRAVMKDPSSSFAGGCKSTECLRLADCVERCNACSTCTGIRYSSQGGGGFRCHMQKDTETAAVLEDGDTNAWEYYINTRTRRSWECPRAFGIRGLHFYTDSECTNQVIPDSIQSIVTGRRLQQEAPGACWPGTDAVADFACAENKSCSNQAATFSRGNSNLAACLALCRSDSRCGAVQYECNNECWLLPSCESLMESQCGGSVYTLPSDMPEMPTTTTDEIGLPLPTPALTVPSGVGASEVTILQQQADWLRTQASDNWLRDRLLWAPPVADSNAALAASALVFYAEFSEEVLVRCAVVDATAEFAQGWALVRANDGSTSAGELYGPAAVASPNGSTGLATRPGSLVSFTGDLSISCATSACLTGDSAEKGFASTIAAAVAVPIEMVDISMRGRLLGETPRELQASSRTLSYRITLLMDHPADLSKPITVASALESAKANLPALTQLFRKKMPLFISAADSSSLEVTSMTEYDKVVVPPAVPSPVPVPQPTPPLPVSPSPSPSVSFPSPPSPPSPPTPSPTEEEELGSQVIIGLSVATGLLLFACLFCAYRRYLRRKMVARAAAVTPIAVPDPPAPVVVGSAKVVHEDSIKADPISQKAARTMPSYWKKDRRSLTTAVEDERSFDDLLYVQHEDLKHFQDLMNFCYRDIVTQDRPCPNGKCDKQRGGCPCVQPITRAHDPPGLPTGYEVLRVIRVEDSGMWERYVNKRDSIRNKRTSGCEPPDPLLFTTDASSAHSALGEVLHETDSSLNEAYLFHGTQVRKGLTIAQEDFSLSFAGSGAGTMYGKGLYFTESCTKADEYARTEKHGHYAGVHAMLLCRVCIGTYHYTTDREPSAIDHCTSGATDSTIGDRAKAVGTYREIVVYDSDQVYPEYLVIYKRLHGGTSPQLPSKAMPFQLELPLYWVNVGKNPYEEPFREHIQVRKRVKDLITRLASGSIKGGSVKVRNVQRIEDSALWCRYIDWRRQLRLRVEAAPEDRCVPPNELDGNPESGHTLTQKLLEEHGSEEVVSVENLVEGLNELLLWHGTSKEAATAIATQGFLIGSATHGRRFGNGTYLAEDLSKSLDYAREEGGVKYVLLCRAVCGHMYYTEEHWDSSADAKAKRNKKNSVLANPNTSGPREYILFEEAQVYPEYLIQFQT
eukprot:TRINITY_DN3560_c0_g1_i4.p1 TRINITY_DN3560_c0_g1~~TRINITY_DN3560_c0_g1_i4.p1  ORF type:complete len:1666 (+),score=300.28 TRINITY_DN3560_c0_g1_i4:61-4998(+)